MYAGAGSWSSGDSGTQDYHCQTSRYTPLHTTITLNGYIPYSFCGTIAISRMQFVYIELNLCEEDLPFQFSNGSCPKKFHVWLIIHSTFYSTTVVLWTTALVLRCLQAVQLLVADIRRHFQCRLPHKQHILLSHFDHVTEVCVCMYIMLLSTHLSPSYILKPFGRHGDLLK